MWKQNPLSHAYSLEQNGYFTSVFKVHEYNTLAKIICHVQTKLKSDSL